MSTRNIQIPVIHLNKLVIVDDEYQFDSFYGINDLDNEPIALAEINKFISDNDLPKSQLEYDFRNETQVAGRRWTIEHGLNVYIATEITLMTALIADNKENFEKVFWYRHDKKQ